MTGKPPEFFRAGFRSAGEVSIVDIEHGGVLTRGGIVIIVRALPDGAAEKLADYIVATLNSQYATSLMHEKAISGLDDIMAKALAERGPR